LCIHAGASLFTCAAGFCWNLFALKIRFKKALENLEKKKRKKKKISSAWWPAGREANQPNPHPVFR
jgi:hypothetical protein